MFKRRLNKVLAIVIAVATVATSALPASVYAAEFDNLVTVETEDAFETTEEVVGIVEDVTTDDQNASDAVEETEEVIILDDFVSENAAFAAADLSQKTYNFSQLTKYGSGGYGYNDTVEADGKVTLVVNESWKEVFYAVPDDINSYQVKQIVANLESGDASTLSLRCRDAKGDEISAWTSYETNTINPNGEFAALGIANKSNDVQTYVISSLTFYIDETIEAPKEDEVGQKTYDFNQLTKYGTGGYGYTDTIDADGKVTLVINESYQEVFYAVPSDIKSYQVKKIVANLESGDASTLSLRCRDANGEEISAWSNAASGTNAISTYGEFAALGIANKSNDVQTYVISSLTFYIDETIEAPDVDVPKSDNVYNFNEIDYAEAENTNSSVSIDEEGVLTVTFTNQYAQAFFKLPSELDKKVITKVTWNLAEESASDGMSPKILTEEDFNTSSRNGDVGVNYNASSVLSKNDELGHDARYIAIMTTKESADGQQGGPLAEPLVMKFTSVTIEYKAYDRVVKNNLLANYNGNFEYIGWWNDASWSENSLSYTEYSDSDKAPNNKVGSKYVKVSGSKELQMNNNVGIKGGNEYEVSFWARHDNASEESKNPKIDFIIQMNDNSSWGANDNLIFDDENNLSEEWQKYSGIIEISETSFNSSKILISVPEGVDFSVDDIQIGRKRVASVQEDIPNFHEEVALKGIPMSGVAISSDTLNDELAMKLVFKHFNSISCENAMKPEVILGSAPKTPVDSVDDLVLHFEESEKTCDAIWKHNIETGDNIKMRGHVFVWHSQTPTWFFREGFQQNGAYVSKEVMNQRIDDYIRNVAEHYDEKYPGLIYAWDVVNEQASDSNGIRMGTDWSAVYGGSDEYIIQAFKSADLYLDEETILFYNDYNECTPNKCKQICKFLEKIKQNLSDGRKLGAGMQGHHDMATPDAATIEAAVRAYAEIADVVHVTELDIKSTMNFRDDTQEAIDAEAIANGQRYRQVYEILEKVNDEYGQKKVQCVTIWGTHDAVSWLKTSNSVGGSADGKTPQYPLIFDDYYQAKPAFWAIIDPNGEKYPDKVLPSLPETPEKPNEVTIYDGIEADWIDLGVSDDGKVSAKAKIVVDVENNISVIIETICDGIDNQIVEVSINGKKVEARPDTEAENILVESIDGGYRYTINDLGELSGDNLLHIDIYGDPEYELEYTTKVSSKEALVIPRGTIVVDGKVDSAWDLYAGDAHKLTVASAPSLAEGEVKYLWDEDNLYILMDVTDSIIDVTARDEYQQDSIEMFIDENNHKTGSYEDDDKQYRVSATNYQSFNNCVAANIKSEVIETADGYLLEAALAWTDIEPENGTIIGLDIQINDAKNGSRTGTVNLFDGTGNGYQSTANYGTAILTGEDTEDLNVQAIDAQVYTGKAIKPSVVVRQAGKKLIEGKDYTLSYKNNIKAAAIKGNGLGENFDATLPTVIITGKGNFKGKVMANFEISKAKFGQTGFDFVYKNNVVETKTATKPAVTVKYNGLTVAKTEYTVKYLQPAFEGGYLEIESIPANEPDTYKISITANDNSNFVGSATLNYVVVSKAVKNVSKLNITIPNNKLDYTGEDVMPAVVVKDGTKVVEANNETAGYTVEYADNVMPGTAKAIITGTGNYVGSVTKTFTIKGTAVSKLGITLSETKVDYSGVAIKPVVTVKDGTETLEEVENALANGYMLEYADNLMPGKATVTITGCGKYTGSVKKTFTINGKPVSKLSITVAGTGLYYNNGEEIKPEIVIKDGTETLEEVKDVLSNGYKLDFDNNVMPGKATVTITGCGKYTGSVKKTFTINGFNFASAIIAKPENKPFNNKTYKTIELDVKYKVTTDEMVKFFSTEENPVAKNNIVTLDPKYYTVTLVSGGTNAGTATYKVTGNGIFTGSKNVSLTIDKVDAAVEESAISLSAIKDVRFVQGNNKPTVVVRADKRVLKSGVDYTVTYSNNSKVTDAAVATVTLKGNYKGKLTGTFKILPAIMNESYVATAKDIVATAKGAYKSTIVVTKPDGKKLTAKTDYDADIKYYIGSDKDEANLVTAANLADKKSSLVAGTKMVAVITGKGNYEGSVKTSFYLVDAMATSASFKINDKVYTGRKIELTGDDFVTASVKVGGKVVKLEYGKDFDVKYLGDQKSYGTQKVEIIPKAGDPDAVALGGTKTVSFKITPKDMKWSDEILFSIQNLLGLFD